MQNFKRKLARVFDDNLETNQWKNILDYTIIGLILLSLLEVFLSTYDDIAERYGKILHFIDVFTTIAFTVEVTLRIWCADLIDDKYKGFWGRVRYCFSFYGMVDFLATYTFYIALVLPMNYAVFKTLRLVRVLRVFRLLRVFRYMKSIRVLGRAMQACKTEMVVSLQFLCIITLFLSFILFFVEHEVQPEVYDNGWTSVAWAFAQYVGDPGGFADTPPVTPVGQVIAFLIGVLGVAIFAVPAGLIGSAFSDVMAEDQHEQDVEKWTHKVHLSFGRKLDRPTGLQVAPRFMPLADIQARMGLKVEEIMDVIEAHDDFRLINIACTQTVEEAPNDRLAVEHFPLNTVYGCCIDRGSKITIFNSTGIVDPIMSWWSYYLAKIGGFNYVSRELGQTRPYQSFYLPKTLDIPGLKECMADLNHLLNKEDHWVITILAASGANEPSFPTQFHFGYGGKKGDETYDDPQLTLNDIPTFDALYKDVEQMLAGYGFSADRQRYHGGGGANYFARKLNHKVNAITLRVAWSITCRDTRAILLAKELAGLFRTHCEPGTDMPDDVELKQKDIAYDGYTS